MSNIPKLNIKNTAFFIIIFALSACTKSNHDHESTHKKSTHNEHSKEQHKKTDDHSAHDDHHDDHHEDAHVHGVARAQVNRVGQDLLASITITKKDLEIAAKKNNLPGNPLVVFQEKLSKDAITFGNNSCKQVRAKKMIVGKSEGHQDLKISYVFRCNDKSTKTAISFKFLELFELEQLIVESVNNGKVNATKNIKSSKQHISM